MRGTTRRRRQLLQSAARRDEGRGAVSFGENHARQAADDQLDAPISVESLTPIGSGDSLHVIRENVIDECLIADVSPFGFLTQTAQYISIESDCNELSGLVTKRRPPHTPHYAQLFIRQLWDV